MPQLKCPRCAREVPAGSAACPWDGTPINSVVVRQSLWGNEKTELRPPSEEIHSRDTDDLPALLPGQKLGDYQVLAVLGSGGMGEVYSGEQPMIGKKVAIKVLKAEVAADPANVQRMLSEARAVNAIRHRGIVDIFNFGNLPDGRPYLVMEYLEGTPLDVMLKRAGALIPPEATEFLEEICSALSAAHQRSIVHRDLKPANVFIVGDARSRYVKLLDFGLAKGAQSPDAQKQTRAGMVVGTPDYIAPEQARGGTITPRTDLYSLGVMAFEMLTGSLPFTADSVVELMMMHVQEPPPRVSSRIDFCPPALDALIHSMMQKDPADRPRSAEQVRLEIARIRRELREGETITGGALRPPAPTQTVKDTIRIPTPPDLPAVKPEARPRPARPPTQPPRTVEVDPTARYAAVPDAKKSRAWIAAFVLPVLLVAGVGAWWYFTQYAPRAAQPPIVVEPPPETKRLSEIEITAPDTKPAPPRPPKAQPKAPGVPALGELTAELNAWKARSKASPSQLETLANDYRKKFNDAATPDDKRRIIADIHNRER